MLTLADISAKYSGAANLVIGGERVARPAENEDDPEWEVYLEKVQNEEDQVIPFLHSELQRKSNESGGKCVEYLRKLFVHTHRIAKIGARKANADKSFVLIFRTLFGLAKGQWSLPSQVMDDVIACGINAIRDYSSAILVHYLKLYAMIEMQNADEQISCRWIEIFAKFIAVLSEKGDIPHESDILKGSEFREYIVEEICRMDWSKPVVKSYLTILEEIHGIEQQGMDVILDKFGSTLPTMRPSFVHSCVEQIIGIAGNLRPARVLVTFDKYFANIQAKPQQKPAPASRKQGKKGKRASVQEVSLGIVACNFVDASRHCDPLIREILKRVKASIFDHTLVMTPFVLAVVLALTNVDYLRHSIIDPLKTAILKNFHELNLCEASCWYKYTIGDIRDDITDCFKYVLKEGSSAMDYMCDGLKELGISLLNCGHANIQGKYPMTFGRCQELGIFLVTTVVMMNKEQLGLLLKELLKPESSAHIDCLAACLTQCSRAVGQRDFHGRISELLHHLPSMSVESASVIIKSLLPSLQLSPALLDDLMIVLRKTFWKSVDAGRICVEVICVILSNTYLMGNSQFVCVDAPNDDLLLSQLTQGNSRTNVDYTPLCREILNLGKRFFLLDCRVREQLYLGLHRVARRNPMVNDVISGQLHAHMSQYMCDFTTGCPLLYRKLFEFSPSNERKASVKDELGFLVQCMGFVYNKTNLASGVFLEGHTETSSFTNCSELLKKLVTICGSLETSHIEIVASSIIADSGIQTDDVIRYVRDVLCIQTMQMMEALIEFMALGSDWPGAKKAIDSIFENYTEFGKFLKKNPSVKKGKGEKGKGNAKGSKNGNTQGTQPDTPTASVASGSETGAVAKAKRVEPLKPPSYFHVINLDSVCQMLREIYGPLQNTKFLRNVHGDDGFELMLLNTVKDKVTRLKLKDSIRERQRAPVDTLNSLSCLIETIWERLCTMEGGWKRSNRDRSCDSGGDAGLSESTIIVETRLDVIFSVMDLLYNQGHYIRVKYFNKYLGGVDRDDGEFCASMFEKWQKILKMVTSVYDGLRCTCNQSMFAILNYVCKVLASIPVLQQVQDWCWNYFRENVPNQVGTTRLLEVVIKTFFTCNVKCTKYSIGTNKDALKLAKAIPLTIGSIQDDEDASLTNTTVSWLVTKETAPSLLICIANYVDQQLSMLSNILGRLKSHRQYLGNDRSLEMRDKCFVMIESICRIVTELVKSRNEVGPSVGIMLKLVTQFYSVLCNFAEHLIDVNKSTPSEPINIKKFKNIVTDLGRQMKPLIEGMISHVELIHRDKVASLTADAKKSTKVPKFLKTQFSKDAKLIPDMVYQVERFDQLVIAFSKKVKVDMLVGLKLSTARDFRIEGEEFRNALAEQNLNEAARPDTAATSSTRPGTSFSTGTEKPGSKLSRKRK